MNTKVWYLPYFEGVFHTRMIETFTNANALMVRMLHTMELSRVIVPLQTEQST
mgnify:CR=1 FL=1